MVNNKESKKRNGLVKAVGLGMVILMLSSGVAFMLNLNDEAGDELINDKRTLGNDLDNTGWMLFIQKGCPACEVQKQILGSEISGLKIVDCAASREDGLICAQNDIRVIPTWKNVFSNETIEGVQQFSQLEEMTE